MKIVKQYHLHKFIIAALICTASSLFAQEIILPDVGVCAHRGAMDTYPENTIPAFEEAIRLGVQMIELDVRLTKDKYLVIIHDETVNRTTGGSGKIEDLTLSDIRSLDAGSWKSSEFKNIRVPTFSEVLLIMPKNIWLNVHLKGEEELGRKVAIEILEQNRAHQAFLACGTAAAAGARSVSTDIMICNMERQTKTDDYVDQTIANKNQFIQLYKLPANKKIKSYTTRLKENGIKINYCCTDSPKEVKKLHKYGVDFVLVNKPESVLENINLVDR